MIIFDYSFRNTGGGEYIRAKTCGTQHSKIFKKIFFSSSKYFHINVLALF